MKLFVLLAIFDACPAAFLNDPAALRTALDLAVTRGPFTGLGTLVVPFSPQGVTACAVVGESHIALHTWPEEGRLFVDIASWTPASGPCGSTSVLCDVSIITSLLTGWTSTSSMRIVLPA